MTPDGYGIDPTGLGRWNWVRLRGANGIKTRFICAYRPCKSKQGTGTTWTQQVNYFQEERDIALKTAIVIELILWLLRFMTMLAIATSTVILTTY